MSLPARFNTTLKNILKSSAYLHANSTSESHNVELIDQGKFSVGLFWSGNPEMKTKDRRACDLVNLLPLWDIPNVNFYSLQVGAGKEQIEQLPDNIKLHDLTDGIKNFLQTAELIKSLDLVITVDTSVAHLAGALGEKVWTILDKKHCWRYGLDNQYSPWYPSMRLFRQTENENWATVIQEVKNALIEELGSRAEQ
jgi:hypothetical protein